MSNETVSLEDDLLACACFFPHRVLDFKAASGVVVELKTAVVYDTHPKLRLKGSGFQAMADDPDNVQLTFTPHIAHGEAYTITVKSDIVAHLELIPGRR